MTIVPGTILLSTAILLIGVACIFFMFGYATCEKIYNKKQALKDKNKLLVLSEFEHYKKFYQSESERYKGVDKSNAIYDYGTYSGKVESYNVAIALVDGLL